MPPLARASNRIYKKCAGRAVAGLCYSVTDAAISYMHISICIPPLLSSVLLGFSIFCKIRPTNCHTDHTGFHTDFGPIPVAITFQVILSNQR
jgi:hypothetical protein